MVDIPSLDTERLILRAPWASDFPAYETFYADAEASKFYGGPKGRKDSWNRLACDIGHWHLRGYGVWAIERRDDGAVVGGCGLVWPQGWPRSELTWWITADARKRGYAKEASKAAIQFGYDVLEWELVETHMMDDNVAARQLVLSLGGVKIARDTFPDGHSRDVFKMPRPE